MAMLRMANENHKPLATSTTPFKIFSYVCITVQWPYYTCKLVIATFMIGSAFFHETELPQQVARIANNEEHVALQKSTNIKTQPTTPIITLSFGLKNINDTKFPELCIASYYTYLENVFFHAWRALLGFGLLIFHALWSQLGSDYAGLLYTRAASEFNSSFKLACDEIGASEVEVCSTLLATRWLVSYTVCKLDQCNWFGQWVLCDKKLTFFISEMSNDN